MSRTKSPINIFMFTVNLPAPSQRLIDAVYHDLAETLPNHIYFWDKDENWPLGACENIPLFDHTNSIGIEEYQHHFNDTINVCGLLFVPDPRVSVSQIFPHADIQRTFGINYVLEAGGDNVTTTLYNQIAENDINFPKHDDLTVLESNRLTTGSWYGLNGLRYHSVENLTNRRLLLSITLVDINHDIFVDKHRDLINPAVFLSIL